MGYLLLVGLLFGIAGGLIGRSKGSSFAIWFLISACVPVFGLIAAYVYRGERDEPMRACPRCGRLHPLHDSLCMGCGMDLEYPEPDEIVAPAPQLRLRPRL